MEKTDTESCGDAAENKSKDIPGHLLANEKSLVLETDKKDLSETLIMADKKYITWENDSNSCWLDSSLSLLAHNQTMRMATSMNPACQVSLAIKSFDEAISTLNDSSSDRPLEERLAIAKSILQKSQESCLKYLQPLIKYKKGEPDSAFCSLLNLIKEDKVIQGYFDITFSWVRCCDDCEVQRILTVTKPIITIARVDVFVPESLISPYQCQLCKKNNQKMKLLYKKLPECLIYHFENGAGTSNKLPHAFTVASREYILTSVMMLEKGQESNVNHFVSYIRDFRSSSWLECNDLNPEMVSFVEGKANFKLEDVYICVFEAFDDLGTIEVEGEPSLIYSDLSIPCIDLSSEEDKASPKRVSENKDSEANDDAETVENVKKFLTASQEQGKDQALVKEDLLVLKSANPASSKGTITEGLSSLTLKLNVMPKEAITAKEVRQEDLMCDNKPKNKKVNIPVKGFDVEKFVEQKLSELAANQKGAFTLGLKMKANTSAIKTEKKVCQSKNEAVSGPKLLNSRSRKNVLCKKVKSPTKKKPFKKIKDLPAEQSIDHQESLNSSPASSKSESSTECLKKEIKTETSTSHSGETFNEMQSEGDDDFKISISDVKSLYENENDDVNGQSDLLVSSKLTIGNDTDKKDTTLNADKSKQDVLLSSLKVIKHKQTPIKAYVCNQSNNDSLIDKISCALDNKKSLSSPNEVFVRLKDKTKKKLYHVEKSLKSEPDPQKGTLKNCFLTVKSKNSMTAHKDLSDLGKDNGRKMHIAISKSPGLSASSSPMKESLNKSVSCSTESLNGEIYKISPESKVFSNIKQPSHHVQFNSNSCVSTQYHNFRKFSQSQTQIIQTSTCRTYSKSGKINLSQNSETKVLKSPEIQNHVDSSEDGSNVTSEMNDATNPKKRILKVKLFPLHFKRKTKPLNADAEEHLQDKDASDGASDATNENPPAKKIKTEVLKAPNDIAGPNSASVTNDSLDVTMKSLPVPSVILQPSSSINVFNATIDTFMKESPLPKVIAGPSSFINVPTVTNIANNSSLPLIKQSAAPNGFAGPSLPLVNVPPMKTIANYASHASVKNSPDTLCLKPNCHCFKVDREKVIDSTVDFFLTQVFQMFPLKSKT